MSKENLSQRSCKSGYKNTDTSQQSKLPDWYSKLPVRGKFFVCGMFLTTFLFANCKTVLDTVAPEVNIPSGCSVTPNQVGDRMAHYPENRQEAVNALCR